MSDDLRLVITPRRASLVDVTGKELASTSVDEPLERRVDDLMWRLGRARRGGSSAEVGYRLRLVGEALGEMFCAGPVGAALTSKMTGGRPVRIGVRADDPLLRDLPWETCIVPGRIRPLALETAVDIYREVPGGYTETANLRAPLRVLVVIAAPDGGPPLNLHAEIERINYVLRSQLRLADSRIRVVSPGTLTALRDAVAEEPFHIVHLSCHGLPGSVLLEDEEGSPVQVSAADLAVALDGVNMVVLAGCHTAVGGENLPGLARDLVAAGIPAVVAMAGPVSDDFSPRLAEHLYRGLAASEEPEPLAVLSAARRDIEAARLASPSNGRDAELVEWATPVLFLGGTSRPLFRLADGLDVDIRAVSPPPDSFVGRRAELRALTEYLHERPLLVLHGIEGIGKTRLAERLVELLRTADRPVVTVTGEITAAALGTVGRPAILLCDSFEPNLTQISPRRHAIRDREIADLFANLLAGPDPVTVVFTSRYPFELGHGNTEIVALFQPPLLDDTSVALLMFRLPTLNALPDDDRAYAVAAIGGHPYALEQLEAELAAGSSLQEAVDACIETMVAYCELDRHLAQLDATARGALLRAAVHRIAATESATLIQPVDVQMTAYADALSILVAKGLVIQQPITQDDEPMLLVPRWVAAVVERRAAPEDARQAHQLAAFAYHIELDALRTSDSERDQAGRDEIDLLTEIRFHHLAAGEQEYSNEATNRLAENLARRGQRQRLALMHRENLQWAEPDSDDAGAAHQSLAALAAERSDYDGSREHATAALRIYERLARRINMAEAQHALAVADEQLGRYAEATAHCTAALDLVADLDAPRVVAICHALLGNLAARRGDPAYQEHYNLAIANLPEAEQYQSKVQIAMIHVNRATALARGGDYEQAIAALDQAAAIYQDLGDAPGSAQVHHDLALISQALGDNPTAQAHLREAVRIRESADDHGGAVTHYHELGILATERGDLDGAEAYHRKELLISQAAGDLVSIAGAYHELGLISRRRGELAEARTFVERALKLKDETGDRASLAASHAMLGQILRDQGEPDQARAQFQLAAELGVEFGMLDDIVFAHRGLGEIALERGQLDAAADAFEKAVAAGRVRHRPDLLLADLSELARLRLYQQDLPTSSALHQEVLDLAEQVNDQYSSGSAHNQLGVIALLGREHVTAREHFAAALRISEELGDQHNVAGTLRNLGNVARDRGYLDEALKYYRRAHDIFVALDAAEDATFGHKELAGVYRASGNLDEARAALRQYAEAAQAANDTGSYIDALLDLAEVEAESGEYEHAVSLASSAFAESVPYKSPYTRRAVELLARQRDRLGIARVSQIVTDELNSTAASLLDRALTLLDQPDEGAQTPTPATSRPPEIEAP